MSTSDKYVRPEWDEYFMEIANTVSKRATCDRGWSGCIIVKDRQILVSGYVGSPPRLPHCDDVGHQFKQTIHEDGSVSDHCIRTIHAGKESEKMFSETGIELEFRSEDVLVYKNK